MNNAEKKENKLKQFFKKHELAFTIAGWTAVGIVGVGLIYLGCRNSTNPERVAMSVEKLATKNKNVADLVYICDLVDKGTAGTSIQTFPEPVTIAECFGDYAENFMKGSCYEPDDIVANIIYNIAKKPET